jgi:hypothetical protein
MYLNDAERYKLLFGPYRSPRRPTLVNQWSFISPVDASGFHANFGLSSPAIGPAPSGPGSNDRRSPAPPPEGLRRQKRWSKVLSRWMRLTGSLLPVRGPHIIESVEVKHGSKLPVRGPHICRSCRGKTWAARRPWRPAAHRAPAESHWRRLGAGFAYNGREIPSPMSLSWRAAP